MQNLDETNEQTQKELSIELDDSFVFYDPLTGNTSIEYKDDALQPHTEQESDSQGQNSGRVSE